MIQISNVSFQYENSEKGALHDVSLTVEPGECILLCGESGCGKTTITRLLNGLIPHFYEGTLNGMVEVCGLKIQEEELYTIAEKVGSVFQNPRSQFFCLDTTSEVAFGCENMGLSEDEIKQRIAKVTRELKMENLMGRNIFKLSGGEKQRVACASVSAMQPEIFVLDEPTSNMDLDAIEELKKTLLFWKKQGKTIVIAEHRLYWLKYICDRVIYMEEGHIVSDLPMKTFVTFSEDRIRAMGLRGLSLSQPEFPEKPEKSGKTITFKNYHFNYEKEEVLHMSDVTVPAESIIAVTGHNGAGKSTFLRCLCGLEKKFKGHTVLDDANLSGRQMLKNCYMVMQDVNHQLFCETVEEEIQLGMAEEKADKVSDLLRELDLAGFRERHPMSLSGGQKQRVAIASAVLAEKSVLIFDEPTSGLDYKHMRQTAGLFQRLKERKKTMFIITHDPELIVMCCTHVLHIEHGEVQEFYPLTREHCGQFMEQFSFS
ncbi:ATP-binding cassette domain-containing protein [Roseburia intestinalis]|uniref:ATP-binding cassette domain-containing protein n=1 Tax=Roseburia intestinalis TaxID=166486 RepID=A0A6L6XHM0_9FIRM|nr:ATP-binding cassette domain-containing protein [Roseburia intestinalis]